MTQCAAIKIKQPDLEHQNAYMEWTHRQILGPQLEAVVTYKLYLVPAVHLLSPDHFHRADKASRSAQRFVALWKTPQMMYPEKFIITDGMLVGGM